MMEHVLGMQLPRGHSAAAAPVGWRTAAYFKEVTGDQSGYDVDVLLTVLPSGRYT